MNNAVAVTASNEELFVTLCKMYPENLKEMHLFVIVDERREGNLSKEKAEEIIKRECKKDAFEVYTEKDMFRWGRDNGIDETIFAEKHLYSNCIYSLGFIFDSNNDIDNILLIEDDVLLFDNAVNAFNIGHTSFAKMGACWCDFKGGDGRYLYESDESIIDTHAALCDMFDCVFDFRDLAMSYHNGGIKLLCRHDWDIEYVKEMIRRFYSNDVLKKYNEKHMKSKRGLKHGYTIICERFENKLANALGVDNVDLGEYATHTSDVKALNEKSCRKMVEKGIVHLFSKNKAEQFSRFLNLIEETECKDERRKAVFINTNRSFTTDMFISNYEGEDDLVVIIDRTTTDEERERIEKVVKAKKGCKLIDSRKFYSWFAEKIGGSSEYLDKYPCMLQLLNVIMFDKLSYDVGAFVDDDFILKKIKKWPDNNAFIMAKFDREKELHSSSSYSKVFEIAKKACDSNMTTEDFAKYFHPGTEKVFVKGTIDIDAYIEMLGKFIHDEQFLKLFDRWNENHKHCGVWNSCEIFETVAFEKLGVFETSENISDTLFIWPSHKLRLRNNLKKGKSIVDGIKDFNKVGADMSSSKMHVGYRGDCSIYWILIESKEVNPPMLESSLKMLENPDLRTEKEIREQKKIEQRISESNQIQIGANIEREIFHLVELLQDINDKLLEMSLMLSSFAGGKYEKD